MQTGTVKFFNVTKGLGKIIGDDGQEVFVHESKLSQVHGLRFLLPGQRVEYGTFSTEKGPQAKDVKVLGEAGVTRNDPDRRGFVARPGRTPLRIDSKGRIYVGTEALRPTVEARTEDAAFRAYYVGANRPSGFELTLPASTADAGFVLLDTTKAPRRITEDGYYENVQLGSYLMKVEKGGKVVVWNLGVRVQGTQYYTVVERRFHHTYQLADVTEDSLLVQTPVSGEKKRDNDGFIRGILKGIEWMQQSATSAAA